MYSFIFDKEKVTVKFCINWTNIAEAWLPKDYEEKSLSFKMDISKNENNFISQIKVSFSSNSFMPLFIVYIYKHFAVVYVLSDEFLVIYKVSKYFSILK